MTPALLFDMDGTLLHSDPLHAAVYIDLLADFGIPLTEARYTSEFLGRRNIEIFAEILPNEDAAALDYEKERRFRERLTEVPDLAVGARDLLERARDIGWATALVTNACRANAEAVLDRFDLADHFDLVALGEERSHGKPHPAVYLHAMSELNRSPDQCIAFEDSPTGLASARDAGAHVVGLTSSLDADTLRAHGAQHTLTDFSDPALIPVLQLFEGPRP